MNALFKHQPVNNKGIEKLEMIKMKFHELHKETLKYAAHEDAGRYLALMETHLEAACMYASKAISVDPQNHPREGS